MLDVLPVVMRLKRSLARRLNPFFRLWLLLIASAGAQAQGAIEAEFVGTWELRAVTMQTEDGRESPVWGEHPIGRLVYDSQGHMFALLMPAERNQADGRTIPDALLREAAGYYGSYVVDKLRRVVTHRVIASVRTNESKAIERAYSLDGDHLTLTARATRDGVPVAYVLTWERLRH
jgi:hypothetical protein